jgi:hypothetical protein
VVVTVQSFVSVTVDDEGAFDISCHPHITRTTQRKGVGVVVGVGVSNSAL